MKTVNIHQVDAFTNEIFGGNPAGVVTNADSLTEAEMQKVAREINLSETAFVLSPTLGEADVKLRFFTPSIEVQFCGHATVGALFQLASLDMFGLGKPGTNDVRVETNIGILSMGVTNRDAPQITFSAPKTDLQSYRLQGAEFAKALGVPADLVDAARTIYLDKRLNYLYVPTVSLAALEEEAFDFGRIRESFGEEGTVVFCLYTNETHDVSADLYARGLAPNVGVDEDPFTGSMQAGLVLSAKANGYVATDKQEVVTEQGHALGRPGSATVRHDGEHDISVLADATPVFSAKMEIE